VEASGGHGIGIQGQHLLCLVNPPGLAGESWFLAWGFKIGDSGARLAIRLYAFNGDEVRVVWKRDGLAAGTLRSLAKQSRSVTSGSAATLRQLPKSSTSPRTACNRRSDPQQLLKPAANATPSIFRFIW